MLQKQLVQVAKGFIGIRCGEKVHEEMIAKSDAFTIDLGSHYAILPSNSNVIDKYHKRGINYNKVPNDFSYNSGTNKEFLSINEIRDLIKKI